MLTEFPRDVIFAKYDCYFKRKIISSEIYGKDQYRTE